MRATRYVLSVMALWLAVLGSAYSQTALQFIAIPPCRLLDTRSGDPLMGNQALVISVHGACGIPASAQAYSFNVTVVPHGSLNFLTLWPEGQPQPTVSTMNSYDGRIKAVAAIIPAGTGGAIDAFATDTTDLILDINGYFTASSSSTLAFYPVTPCRLYDTRSGNFLPGQSTTDFTIQGLCGLPTTASAYSFNLTALPRTPSLNFLTAWPTGQPQPETSTLNAPTGAVTANAAIVQGGTGGNISVFTYDDIDLLIDVDGYFAPPGAAGQLSLYPVTPCRVLDTRPAYFVGQQTVQVESSPCAVPAGAQAYVVNATVLPQVSLGFLTLWGQGQQPTVSTLNASDGAVTSNLAIVPANATDGTMQAFASDSTQLLIDIFSFMAPPLAITTTTLPGGSLSQPYQAPVAANGGVPPYSWTVSSGNLPPGLMIDAGTGSISGTPTSGGIFSFTVQVTDSQNNTAAQPLSIVISTGTLMITTTQLPTGTQGTGYSATLMEAGGVPPFTWSIASGSLPTGLMLNAGSGVISGTPTGPGTSNFTAQVTDATQQMAQAPLQIVINSNLTITTTQLPSGTQGISYSTTLAASGGTPPYTWSIVSGTLPPGLTLDTNAGTISGTPTTPGTSSFRVQVTDSQQQSAHADLVIIITGHYAFSLSAYKNGEPLFMAGSLNTLGDGTLTAVLDYNEGAGSQASGYSCTGTYTINVNGLGTLTLNCNSFGVLHFHIALSQSGSGELILEGNDTHPRGSGEIVPQNYRDFVVPPAGNYVIGSLGADHSFARYAKAGTLQVTSIGSVPSGFEDINDNGVLSSRTFGGQFQEPNPQPGRGQVTFNFPNGVTNNYAYYVVARGEYIVIGTDPLSAIDPLTLGRVQAQIRHGFSNTALNGTTVVETSGLAPNGGQPVADTVLGLGTWDGNGNGSVSLDENRGGTITQQQVSQGTYSIAVNGKVTLTGFGNFASIFYLTDLNQGFILGQDNSVAFGVLEPQSAGPFNNMSVNGAYVGGTIDPAQSAVVESVAYLLSDGNGDLTGVENYTGSSGTGMQNLSATYQVDTTGRAVVTGTPAGYMYVVSAGKVVFLPTGNAPALSVFQIGPTNQ